MTREKRAIRIAEAIANRIRSLVLRLCVDSKIYIPVYGRSR